MPNIRPMGILLCTAGGGGDGGGEDGGGGNGGGEDGGGGELAVLHACTQLVVDCTSIMCMSRQLLAFAKTLHKQGSVPHNPHV